jgi:hypothetical protein
MASTDERISFSGNTALPSPAFAAAFAKSVFAGVIMASVHPAVNDCNSCSDQPT